jgi:hypothetical protein
MTALLKNGYNLEVCNPPPSARIWWRPMASFNLYAEDRHNHSNLGPPQLTYQLLIMDVTRASIKALRISEALCWP